MLFEGVDHINESVSNISSGTFISTVFNFEGSSVVIGGIRVPFVSFRVNSLGWVGLRQAIYNDNNSKLRFPRKPRTVLPWSLIRLSEFKRVAFSVDRSNEAALLRTIPRS
jgi:hypothetical protein